MNKKVLVFGSGISGIGACQLLEAVGKDVVLSVFMFRDSYLPYLYYLLFLCILFYT